MIPIEIVRISYQISKAMTLEQLQQSSNIILKGISGSRAYGLNTPTSDTDIRGVFILPKKDFYTIHPVTQINDDRNDIVYYELSKFFELLNKNNPNILDLLCLPEHCVLKKHPLFDDIKPEMFISRRCEKSFLNYAYNQIKKAHGLNKKILNPEEPARKSVLDFCFVYRGKQAISLIRFLQKRKIHQGDCGLATVPHLPNCYNLFLHPTGEFKGIIRSEESNDVQLSSIPKEAQPLGLLHFNKDGYSSYCKKYREYWEWVKKRNDARYQNTLSHGKNYDSKNMMHTFRLLLMAKEIAEEGRINVYRHDREYLLDIKAGKYEYEELLDRAEALKTEVEAAFQKSGLPEQPDIDAVNEMLFRMREKFYDL